jgi:uncharacterized OB-fold protein
MNTLDDVLQSKDAEQFRPYFDGAAEGKLLLPRCERCAMVAWYPVPFCRCGGSAFEWTEYSTEGSLYSYCVVHRNFVPHLTVPNPYIPIVVSLHQPGVRFVSAAVDIEVADLRIDMPLIGTFGDPFGNGRELLYFRAS